MLTEVRFHKRRARCNPPHSILNNGISIIQCPKRRIDRLSPGVGRSLFPTYAKVFSAPSISYAPRRIFWFVVQHELRQSPCEEEETGSTPMPSLNTHAFAPSRGDPGERKPSPHVPSPALTITSGRRIRLLRRRRGLEDPSEGPSRFAHADAIVWDTIRKTIDQLPRTAYPLCAFSMPAVVPGLGSEELPFTPIISGLRVDAIGVDISEGQLKIARKQAENFKARLQMGGGNSSSWPTTLPTAALAGWALGEASPSGTTSIFNIAAKLGRGRMTAKRSSETSTSGTSSRLL